MRNFLMYFIVLFCLASCGKTLLSDGCRSEDVGKKYEVFGVGQGKFATTVEVRIWQCDSCEADTVIAFASTDAKINVNDNQGDFQLKRVFCSNNSVPTYLVIKKAR
jgi:hypothetical protein